MDKAATPGDQAEDERTSSTRDEALRGWTAIMLSLLFVGLTTALFGGGQAYREGYLYQFGFDVAQLPSDFHETLYWGFIGGTNLAVVWLVAMLIVMLGYGLLDRLANVVWTRAKMRWRLLRRIGDSTTAPKRRVETHTKFIVGGVLVLPALYLLILARFGIAEFYELGAKQGKQRIAALRADPAAASAKHNIQWIEIWSDSSSSPIAQGYRLLCTDKVCSIYDPQTKDPGVRLVSLESVRQIRIFDKRKR